MEINVEFIDLKKPVHAEIGLQIKLKMIGSEQHFPYLGSPLAIPSIGLAICSAKRAAATRKAQTFSSPIPTSHPLVQLPLDIILLIADQICPAKEYITSNVVDLQNIISASGWLLPEGF